MPGLVEPGATAPGPVMADQAITGLGSLDPRAVTAEVASLTVVYDGGCALCRRCRDWVMSQPQLVPFRFVAASEPWVRQWLGGLVPVGDDLVVIDDGGRAWVGPEAFVVCLWGLDRYRTLSVKLQQTGGRLLAKHLFHSVSAGRGTASWFLRNGDDRRGGSVDGSESRCEDGSCAK
ncbi:MAG: DCC1-like thiol-disulfide oxidoreductase family protein [Acidimicrobiales bacterium]